MATIDIALPDELTQALSPPVCADLSLPSLGSASLTLPTGLKLQGMPDLSRGIPTDCSMNINLMLQLAPLMASMDCLLRVLKFIGVAVGIIKGATALPSLLTAIPKIVQAAEDLLPCLEIAIPGLPICTFLKDLLLIISSMILCIVKELESILNILSGLELQLALAEANGNADLLAALQCSQQNAQTSAQGAMQSMQPILVLLSLAGTFAEIAGVNINISIPSAVPASDLAALRTLLDDLGEVATIIQEVAEALPC